MKQHAASHHRPPVDLSLELIRALCGPADGAGPGLGGAAMVNAVDVGVRGGFDERLKAFGDRVALLGVEPDADEVARLRDANTFANATFLEAALWSEPTTLPLHMTRDRSSASPLPPDMDYYGQFPTTAPMEVEEVRHIEAVRLDDVATFADGIDLLKLDVQGAELEVLKGAAGALRDEILFAIVELPFERQYVDGATFTEICDHMHGFDFDLVDLDIRRWRRTELNGDFDRVRVGPIAYADGLFMKRPAVLARQPAMRDRRKVLAFLMLCEYFSLIDVAIKFAADNDLSDSLADAAAFIVAKLNSNKLVNVFSRTVVD